MNDTTGIKKRNQGPERASRRARMFIEELSWLLDNFRDVSPKDLKEVSSELQYKGLVKEKSLGLQTKSKNISFLVGCLPSLFLNSDLFSSNEEIVDFSENVLNLSMPRWYKKSRYDLIGQVVCHATSLSEESVGHVVYALGKIVEDEDAKRFATDSIKKRKITWNQLIQSINNDSN